MKIFSLPEQQKINHVKDNRTFWFSFTSFSSTTDELKTQDLDISEVKSVFENHNTICTNRTIKRKYEKEKRMV
ncbi:hypothetical protein [Treponema sp.]|uniref:hypothetical protein n=1 Tax=Treponema sp. TaxID=166 RepID=UPI00298EC96E|nr:hypothetical protein [Treponema sp.]MCQ2240794.1 hypothetical protein [Treponema sp.]